MSSHLIPLSALREGENCKIILADGQASNPYQYAGSIFAEQSTSSCSFFLLTVRVSQLRSALKSVNIC